MTTRSLFAAVLLSLLAGAAQAGPFAEVSSVEARQVLGVISTARGGFSGVPQSSIDLLKNIDPKVPEQRAMLGPLNEALGQIYEEGGDKAGVFTRALRIVGARSESLLAAAKKDDASSTELGETVEQLEQLRRLMAFYKPAEAAAFDASVAQARQAFEAKKSAELAAAGNAAASALGSHASAAASAEAVQPAAEASPAQNAEAAVVRSLVEELRETSDPDEGQEIIDRLEKLAKETRSEAAQRAAVHGLVDDLKASSDPDYGQYAIDALARIAMAAERPNIKGLAIQGIMDDLMASSDPDYMNHGVDAVEKIAKESGNEGVKGLAISRLLNERKEWSDSDAREYIQDAVDRIAQSHPGGLAAIPVPSVEEAPAPAATPDPAARLTSWHLSSNMALGLKALAGVLGYLLALKLTPPGVLDQVTGEITSAAIFSWLFPKSDRKLDLALFIIFVAAIVAVPLLAPPGYIVQAVGAIGGAYFLALLFL